MLSKWRMQFKRARRLSFASTTNHGVDSVSVYWNILSFARE